MSFLKLISFTLVLCGLAAADTISPSSFSANIPIGGSTSITKTVTISQQLSVPLDVFFLTDTTGSMGSVIGNIRSGFNSILNNLSSIAPDVAFGAGEYKDDGDVFAYRMNQNLTTDKAAVTPQQGSRETALTGIELAEVSLC